jgi:hypothetical protein
MEWLIKIYQKNKRIFSIAILALCFAFSQESQCRLTKQESIQMVTDAAKAGYITDDTEKKLIEYFSNAEKRKELGAVLSTALAIPTKRTESDANEAIKKVAGILNIGVDANLNRLRSLANLLLPCWTGGMTVSRIAPTGQSFNWLMLASPSPPDDMLTILNGWQKSNIERWLSVAKYAVGKGTDTMLELSAGLSTSQLERSIRLIAYGEMEDSMPV